jgi:UPF0716 protein FxsA
MPLAALLVAFLVVPLVELYLIIEVVGDALGAGPTIALLVVDSVLGAVLLRWQGRTVWRRFIESVQAGRIPHREIVDGVMIIAGGALLITPGFLTDLVGLALLAPPTRAVLRRGVTAVLRRRAVTGFVDVAAGRQGPPRDAARRPYDVEGTARETGDGTVPGERARGAPRRLER